MPKPRKKNSKPIKPELHIFCEGEKTEPIYLEGYLDKFHPSNRRLKVIKVEPTKKNTPVQLVEQAIKLKENKEIPAHDMFWVVYDREAKSKYADSLHQKALDLASRNSIKVALTNVCFEVWLLLHMVNSHASYTSCENLLTESPLKVELKKRGINKYDKADKDIFDLISDKETIDIARKRAEAMNKATLSSSDASNNQPHLLTPYTGVHYLLDAIDDLVKKS